MVYIYKCKECKQQQEEEHSIHLDPKIECKVCGGETYRAIQARPFHLHNEGWYKDGYK